MPNFKTYKHKKQGDNSDSWIVEEWDSEARKVLLNRYMTYEDPAIDKKVDISKIDLETLTDDQLNALAEKLKPKLGL